MNINKVLIIYFSLTFICTSVLYAANDNGNLATTQEVSIYNENNIENSPVTEETYECINELINEIAKELRQIDGKLDKARIMETYERYPLIRLNIDSPYFGIAAITENKLDIKDAVSTLDIARGYSIRSIINSKTILVEDVELTSIVISTKEVKISKEMTQKDASKCLEKLVSYYEQAKNANKFVDLQLKNTFKEYYSIDKNMNIMYIRNEINNTNSILKEVEDILIKMNLSTTCNNSEDFNRCKHFKDKIVGFEKKIDDPMSSEKELQKCVTDIINLKEELSEFSATIINHFNELEEININILLQNALINMNDKINFLKDEEKFPFVMNDEEKNAFSNKYLSSVEKYRDELSEILISGKYNNQNLDFDYEQVKLEVDNIYQVYLNFLNAYNSTLIQYIRYIVTNLKETGLNNLNITHEFMYIYLDLENEMIEISNYFDKESVYSNVICIEKLENIANNVCDLQKNIIEE